MTKRARLLNAMAALALAACATATSSQSRELPAALRQLPELVEGCAPADAERDEQRIACAGDVVLATRAHLEGTEPMFRDQANALAVREGAQLLWDQTVVPTEADSGLVLRARALAPAEEEAVATLIGQTRRLADGSDEEVWCTSRDAAGDERCRALVGALLSRRGGAAARPTTPKPTAASLLGRALSFPTTCAVDAASDDAGAARCDSGVSIRWSAHASMEEALQAVHAHLDAAGEAPQGEALACTIAGEAAQCERRAHSLAGVTYVDGSAVAAVCLGPGLVVDDGGCRALIRAR